MSRSRSESGARAEVRITPHSASEMAPSCSRLTTPYPVTAVPGSIPRMITSAPRLRLYQALFVDVGVRVDLLHVVEVLQRVEQLDELLRIGALHLHGVLRHHGELRAVPLQPAGAQRVLHGVE